MRVRRVIKVNFQLCCVGFRCRGARGSISENSMLGWSPSPPRQPASRNLIPPMEGQVSSHTESEYSRGNVNISIRLVDETSVNALRRRRRNLLLCTTVGFQTSVQRQDAFARVFSIFCRWAVNLLAVLSTRAALDRAHVAVDWCSRLGNRML